MGVDHAITAPDLVNPFLGIKYRHSLDGINADQKDGIAVVFVWLFTEALRLMIDDSLELITRQDQNLDELAIKFEGRRQCLFNLSFYLISALIGC